MRGRFSCPMASRQSLLYCWTLLLWWETQISYRDYKGCVYWTVQCSVVQLVRSFCSLTIKITFHTSNPSQTHLLRLFHINPWTDMVQVFMFATDTHTQTHTCRAITILTLPAAQLRRVSVSASTLTLASSYCENIKWIMQCGRGGALRSAFQSQTVCCPLPCKSDTCLIWHPQFTDPT